MIENIIVTICLFIFFYIYENGLFRLSERKECKKAKGNCLNCKAWSCYKGDLEYKKNKE